MAHCANPLYNKEGDLVCVRVFTLDSKDRIRQGVIYDGKMKPLGNIRFGYDPKTGKAVEERHFKNRPN